MKTSSLIRLTLTLMVGAAVVFSCNALAQDRAVSEVNLAVVAEASSSYVSGDTSLAALNDEYDPPNSRDRRRGSYGNWPRRGTQWVQYDWSRPISTKKVGRPPWRPPARSLPVAVLERREIHSGEQSIGSWRSGTSVQHYNI